MVQFLRMIEDEMSFQDVTGISIQHGHSAHRNEKSNISVEVRRACCQISEFYYLRKMLQLDTEP